MSLAKTRDVYVKRRWRPSNQQRRQVALATAAGEKPEAISNALGIELKILKKFFSHELKNGAAQIRLENLEHLHRAANSGSAPAARKLRDITQSGTGKARELTKDKRLQLIATYAHRGTPWAGIIDDPSRGELKRAGLGHLTEMEIEKICREGGVNF
jgi:hypothetical protein